MSAPVDAVTALVLRERQSRDRGLFDEMADCYTPDAAIAQPGGVAGQLAADLRGLHEAAANHREHEPSRGTS